ncbi:hypothetical protein [Roseibium sediminicola]|uniref:Uncharacterized protein n=1 Tax=Roseibium sediminicola TaxID=2933272 RepID=A0ABT0GRG4_9HYPH|nr:hypothetical protein [Roseibium sp. CAU 1639]MCK7612014.1 hypothetical protein [Roseibium sp. CAU 1639]
MTAAAYNLEGRWDIPAYVWPGVLGLSAALHFAFLVYGLPELPWSADASEILPETEVILEAGGPVFEEVLEQTPQPLDIQETSKTEFVEQSQPELMPVQPVETNDLEVLPSEPVQVEQVQAEPVEVDQLTVDPISGVEAPMLPQAAPVAAEIIESEEVTALQPETVLQEAVPSVETVPVETLDVPPVDNILLPETAASSQIATEIIEPAIETIVPIVVAEPALPAVTPQDSLQPALVAEAASEPLEPLTQQSTLVTDVSPSQVPLQSGQQAEDLNTVVSPVVEVTPLAPAIEPSGIDLPQSASQVILAEETAGDVAQSETVTLTPVEAPEIATIAPETQQLTDVEQVETEVAALTPADPETSAVPSIDEPSRPAEIVPPVEVATIDPLANITSYVKNYDFGDCAHLSVLSAGADSAEVTAFGTGIGAFAVFDQRFKADQGFEAAIQLRLVTQQQCALLNALGVSQGIEAAGLVELDKTVVKSGTLTTGLIQRDLPLARIAAAEEAGLDLGGKGPPELYLIDDAGQIHDGRDFLLPASSATTAGAWRFKVPVVLKSAEDQETALVLAIWNRPVSRQPPRFGTLPPSRVATVLSEPGVYSIAAFKVSR